MLGLFQEDNWGLSEASRSLQALEEVEVDAARIGGLDGGTREPDGMPARTIRFRNVAFTYPGRTRPVFDGFDLELEAGHPLAIVGENGSGKTTLIKLLRRFYDPDPGSVSVDGVDLRELDPVSWQRRVAAVFQDYVRCELTAYENVAYGALHRRDDRDGVAEAARLAGAAAIVERLPDGWSTPLTRELIGGTQLSGSRTVRRDSPTTVARAVPPGRASEVALDRAGL